MAARYIGIYALAYAAITAASRNWRQRSPRQVALLSALAGALAQILHWTGLALIVLAPLTHRVPHHFSMALGVAMPGVVAGYAVLLSAAMRRGKAPATAAEADRGDRPQAAPLRPPPMGVRALRLTVRRPGWKLT